MPNYRSTLDGSAGQVESRLSSQLACPIAFSQDHPPRKSAQSFSATTVLVLLEVAARLELIEKQVALSILGPCHGMSVQTY